nr:hypothetical protein [Tanacetum cinerariifolium]GFC87587.1 hypothetical protein [Tanacetum cinerariifolium]
VSIGEANPGNSAPSDFVPQQHVLEPVGALEDLPFVATLLDTNGCFKEVDCFLCLGRALRFVPWGTISAMEKGLGALKTTCLSAAHIANIWSVKGGSLGWLGFSA